MSYKPLQGRPEFHLKVVKEVSGIVNSSQKLATVLSRVVDHLAQSLQFDVVSVYLWNDHTNLLVLKASHGLKFDEKFPITMRADEGLTGLVFQQKKVVNISPASSHPRYKYFPDSGEWAYESYVGAPIMMGEKCLGVLVAQHHEEEEFHPSCATLFEIIGDRLSGVLEVAGRLDTLAKSGTESAGDRFWKGMGVSRGIWHGQVVVLRGLLQTIDLHTLVPKSIEAERVRLDTAFEKVHDDYEKLLEYLQADGKLGSGELEIFRTQDLLLHDPQIRKALHDTLTSQGKSAELAAKDSIEELIAIYGKNAPEFFKERLNDLRELGEKIVRSLLSERGEIIPEMQPPKGSVVVAHELGPELLLKLAGNHVGGIVTEVGGEAGHMAIVARSLGIPAVTGIDNVEKEIHNGDALLVDGRTGFVFLNPAESLVKEYDGYRNRQLELMKQLREEGQTLDGSKINIRLTANIGFPGDIEMAKDAGLTDVGLFRTEFSFMQRTMWPGAEDQVRLYQSVAKEFEGYVTVRTLDIGSDKQLPYHTMPREENPMLGLRSIRFSMENLDLFEEQILSIIKTMQLGYPLRILLPMVTQRWELNTAKDILANICNELGLHRNERPAMGMMLEVPGVMYQLEEFLSLVDFISLGTNDLIQYLLTVDRNSAQVGHMYCEHHPIVVRFLNDVINRVEAVNKDLTVCGEMAGNPMGLLILLALGFRKFSVTPDRAYLVRFITKKVDQASLDLLREKILEENDSQGMRSLLRQELENISPMLLEID
jgi:phosphotransferase system, enzyme I, PtsP